MRNIGLGIRDNQWDQIERIGTMRSFDEASGLSKWDGFQIEMGVSLPRYCWVCSQLIGEFRHIRKYHEECLESLRNDSRAATRRIFLIKYRELHKPMAFYRGENNPCSKLTEAAVLDIRANWAPIAGRSTYAFARKYGVTPPVVLSVVNGDTWKHVGGAVRFPRNHFIRLFRTPEGEGDR